MTCPHPNVSSLSAADGERAGVRCALPKISQSPISNLPSSPSLLPGLRVCFIAGTLGQGGAERQLFYLVKALQTAGACVKVLSLSQGEFWEARIRALGIEVTFVGKSPSRLNRLIQITREVRRFKPQIVQAQHFYVNLYAVVAARLSGCRDIAAIRSNVTSEIADVGGSLGRASLRWPRMLASNSKAAMRNLVNLGVSERRLFFLPNVIDNSHFAPSNAGRSGDMLRFGTNRAPAERSASCLNSQRVETQVSPGSSPQADAFVILGVGSLVPVKRFDLFLQTLSQLKSKFPVSGIIAGDGPLRTELEARAGQLGLLPETVEFVGRVSDPADLYRRASLLLLTSDHEGTPNVVLEAMASGVPVVATRVGDVPDLLGNGERGRLVAPGDLDGLVKAVGDLLGDSQIRTRLAAQARDYVQSQHSLTVLTEHLTNLYSLTLSGH